MFYFNSSFILLHKPNQFFKTFINCRYSKSIPFAKFNRKNTVINAQRNWHFSSRNVKWTAKVKHNLYAKYKVVCLVLAGVVGVKYVMTSSSCEKIESKTKVIGQKISLQEAIEKGRDLALRIKDETGSPGLVVAVSCDGKQVWAEGMGYADVENRVPCTPDSVMRIASISKPITMTAVARLWENGKLDLDAPIQKYVPDFPEKTVDGEKVTITTRHLVSHLAGIRHYDKTYMDKLKTKKKDKEVKKKEKEKKHEKNTKEKEGKGGGIKKKENEKSEKHEKKNELEGKGGESKKKGIEKDEKAKDKKKEEKHGKVKAQEPKKEFSDFSEYYIKDYYKSVADSLKLFKDDALVHKPGSDFLYTTHGWTLVSAVVEGAAKQSFTVVMETLFRELGMENTYLDLNDILIYHRSRNYIKDKNSRLKNAPYVDNSYKWAGGGFLSTVGDLVKFGNVMLYSFQHLPNSNGTSESGNLQGKSNTDVKTQTTNKEFGSKESSDLVSKSNAVVKSQTRDKEFGGKESSDLEGKSNAVVKSQTKNSESGNTESEFEKKSDSNMKSPTKTNPPDNKTQSNRSELKTGSLAELTGTAKRNEAFLRANNKCDSLPGYLKPETIRAIWSPVERTKCTWDKSGKYGMGWAVIPEKHEHGECRHQRYYATHTGGAIGASSVLLVLPEKGRNEHEEELCPPKGVVVAIVVNMISVGLNSTALKIAKIFEDVDLEQIES